jgi:hypothetical protein
VSFIGFLPDARVAPKEGKAQAAVNGDSTLDPTMSHDDIVIPGAAKNNLNAAATRANSDAQTTFNERARD